MSELFSIVVQRRHQPGQVVMQFKARDTAETAFAAIRDMVPRGGATMIGGFPTHRVMEDDFGCKVDFDLTDIGNICFVDVAQSIEQQASQADMANRVNAQIQANAQREMMKRAPHILAAPPGMSG